MPHTIKLSTKQISELNQQRFSPLSLSKVTVLLHNVRSMHNVGSVFRSADAFGISQVLLSGYTPVPPRPEISKTALGADESVPWRYVSNVFDELTALKTNQIQIVGLEQTTESISLFDATFTPGQSILLIFGNEVTGIDNDILPYIDTFIEIPQFGVKHSLNISVSAGITFFSVCEKLYHKMKGAN